MDFNNFKDIVADNIKDYLPEDYLTAEVKLTDVVKNNDTHYTGLTILKEDEHISPTIYLEDFYKDYENGKTPDEIMEKIADIYVNAKNNEQMLGVQEIADNITNFEVTKDKISARVVNLEANKERLENMPHKEMGDLAITYHIDLGEGNDGSKMSVAINNDMMKQYGVEVNELHDLACDNMERLNPSKFMDIRDVLLEMMVPGYAEMSPEEKEYHAHDMGMDVPDQSMYVLSNTDKNFGAAAVLDSEMMDKIREEVGDFYILPSSVHELLIVPKTADMDLDTLQNMVQDVNATQVAANEVLSDHVYEYDPETKEMFRADKAEEHMKEKQTMKEEKQEKTEKKERPSLRSKLEEKKIESKELAKESKERTVSKDRNRDQSL